MIHYKSITERKYYFYLLFLGALAFLRNKTYCTVGILTIGYVVLIKYFLPGYFIIDYTIGAVLLLSPYIIRPDISKTSQYKYLLLSSLFLILTLISGVKTFFFLAIGLAMLSVIESMTCSIGYLPFFLISLLSPTFKYFNNMLGFPVRLKLSEWTGLILQHIGYKNEVVGNIIILNGTEFSVDPACVGLKMIAFSILTGLLIMAYFQRQTNKSFGFMISSGILLVITGFNIIANLIRIVLLTIFEILPENPLHDTIGIICFMVYVIVPTYFLIKWITGKIREKNIIRLPTTYSYRKKLTINLLLFLAMTTTGFMKLGKQTEAKVQLPRISLSGYSKKIVQEDVLKFEKTGILIYIKPLSRFYGAEHNPMICWVGSGYQFSRINKQTVEGKEIYTGTLKKGNDIIYSAWWFDSGAYQTSNQMDWRWRALKGENFSLVNVNSGNKKTLQDEVKTLLKLDL